MIWASLIVVDGCCLGKSFGSVGGTILANTNKLLLYHGSRLIVPFESENSIYTYTDSKNTRYPTTSIPQTNYQVCVEELDLMQGLQDDLELGKLMAISKEKLARNSTSSVSFLRL